MGNCLCLSSPPKDQFKKVQTLPIETTFELPSPLPSWSQGGGFASGVIDLGGLQVRQISSFNKIWGTHEGGPDNLGATFFEPSSLPEGFSMLGCYGQPNNKPLFGWVLVGKDDDLSTPNEALKKPVDYTLIWSSESSKIKHRIHCYVWLPVSPNGYTAVGNVVTTSSEKPSLDKVRCVRSDLTEESEIDSWIWGPRSKTKTDHGINVYQVRPRTRGTKATGVSTGAFVAQNNDGSDSNSNVSIACLKNKKGDVSSMPSLTQIEELVQEYAPLIYLHPEEQYLPSSVDWFFANGALLYKKCTEESKAVPVPIEPMGFNLPQGGSNDGLYWLDLPVDEANKERVKKGDLQSSQAYICIKPMLGTTFTDIAIWVFYPFNGPARAKVEFVDVPLGKIGEHVGDWEHVTLRISNFNGGLHKVYFSEHSGGTWVDASELEFQNGNRPVVYSALHGHAFYSKPGLVMQGSSGIGIRNDTAKSDMVMDTGLRPVVVAAEYLGTAVREPPWLNYNREWGPKIRYEINDEIKKIEKLLDGKLKTAFQNIVDGLPNELLGEEGPTGPKMKRNWYGDEV